MQLTLFNCPKSGYGNDPLDLSDSTGLNATVCEEREKPNNPADKKLTLKDRFKQNIILNTCLL